MRYPTQAIELMFDCIPSNLVPNHWYSVKAVPFFFAYLKTCLLMMILVAISSSSAMAENRSYRVGEFKYWIDEDMDCQLTNAEVLIRSSLVPVTFKSKRRCKVDLGEWIDPFTNRVFKNNDDLDVMHIVGLKWAFENGADKWSSKKREKFANDVENLLAVSDIENRRRKGRAFTEWLPENSRFHCEYILRFDFIVRKYGLAYSQNEILRAGELVRLCSG